MKSKKYNVSIGLFSLLLSIPAPTLIHEHFNNLITNNTITVLQSTFQGFEAQMMLIMMIIASIGLFAVALYELGGSLITLGNNPSSRLLDE